MILASLITGDAYAPFGARTVYKGGGGGGQQTQTTGIPDWARPQLEEGLDINLERLRETQETPNLLAAGLTETQQQALQAQKTQAQDAIAGTGMFDTSAGRQRDLQNLMGTAAGRASTSGGLGSARFEKAMAGSLADRSLALDQERQRVADMGIKNLGSAGSAEQQQKQKELEAKDTSLANFFANLQGAGSETKTTGGGGGK